MTETVDVLVVGAGLAGLAAALAAKQQGASVLVLERAPLDERGGNTRFSNGAMRAVYAGVDDIVELVGDITPEERARADFGSYTREQYYDDIGRVTQYRADPMLSDILVEQSGPTMRWLKTQGVSYLPLYEWQFKLPDGRIKFSGGSAVEARGGGDGISAVLFRTVEKAGIPVMYETTAVSLIDNGEGICGARVRQGRRLSDIMARTVVLAAGGFEANTEWRTKYLGPGWELAKVRGSRFNTGDGLRMALEAGAMAYGHWSGCHSASWDLNAPDVNTLEFGTVFKRDDFMHGLMINLNGERFVDEGADVRAMTYAKMGRTILAQPGQIAWQVYDAQTAPLLHGEYRVRQSARFRADTLEELAGKMEGVNQAAFLATVESFNRAVRRDIPFDPGKKDGRCTEGLAIPKSHWATAIEEPPFEAYAVTCGITFTFGGVRIADTGQVMDVDDKPIPGLFAAGEMVGGVFYFNYPGGAGLMSAAVFGRLAGTSAAAAARGKDR